MNLIETQERIEEGYTNALQLQDRPGCPNPQCGAFWDWHKDGFCLKNFGCSLTQEEVLANPRQDDQIDPVYLAALQELAKIEGLAKINTCAHLVAAIFGKSFAQVLIDSVNEAPVGITFGTVA